MIELIRGDITKIKVDAIVNAANSTSAPSIYFSMKYDTFQVYTFLKYFIASLRI